MEIVENKICLDTQFLVDLLNNKKYAVDFISEAEGQSIIGVSIITIFELFHGAYLHKNIKQLALIEELCSRLNILNLSQEIVKESGKISAELVKSGKMIEFRDILIGVSAKVHDYCLKTKNVKHFNRIDGLEIL